MSQLFYRLVWLLSETLDIGLGKHAPVVFSRAFGIKGEKVITEGPDSISITHAGAQEKSAVVEKQIKDLWKKKVK